VRIAVVGTRGVPALYGGFETAVEEISKRLVERGHEVTVYCRPGYGDDTTPTYLGIQKRYLPRLHLKTAETLSHTLFAFLDLLFREPDVILVTNPGNGPLCLIPRLRGTPFAINVGGLEWTRSKWSRLGRAYIRWAAWFTTKIAPAVIADSRGIQEFYRTTWGRETYYASYGAYPEHSTRPELLARYGLEKNGYLLVVARLQPDNNTELVIRAFQEVATEKELIIVGEANYGEAYVRRLQELARDRRIRFLGGIYDQALLTEIMCNCFAYVHGHMAGGTNPVLLKALGCGACILYLDTGYRFNTEVVGDHGIPFPLSVEGLRRVIQDLLDNPERADHYRRIARERIGEAYNWDLVADQYESLFQSLCSAKA
jgi:glycosyltransferase involved in cell wall biosynthesis